MTLIFQARRRTISLPLAFLLCGWFGCSTAGNGQGASSASEEEPVLEREGFFFYEGSEPARPYTVLGLIDFESPAGRKKESVLREIRSMGIAMGGNAVIGLTRDSVLESNKPVASFDLGIPDINDLAFTVLEQYRWRATVVLLQ